jgi:hypothetical protein
MTAWSAYLRALRLPLAVLALSLFVGVFILKQSGEAREEAEAHDRELRSALASTRARIEDMQRQDQMQARYKDEYGQLAASGLIGEARRERWLDALDVMQRELRVGPMDYSLSPAESSHMNGDTFQVSEMTLRFRVLHEERLLSFLEALTASDAGLAALRRCVLMRDSDTGLRAECGVEWYNLPVEREADRS